MALKYTRKYNEIVNDLVEAVKDINDFHQFIEMDIEYWNDLSAEDKYECFRTASSDILFGLGTQTMIHVGSGMIKYNIHDNHIKVYNGDNCVHIVNLV